MKKYIASAVYAVSVPFMLKVLPFLKNSAIIIS